MRACPIPRSMQYSSYGTAISEDGGSSFYNGQRAKAQEYRSDFFTDDLNLWEERRLRIHRYITEVSGAAGEIIYR